MFFLIGNKDTQFVLSCKKNIDGFVSVALLFFCPIFGFGLK